MAKNRKMSDGSDRRREVLGVIGLGLALFLLIAMVSLQLGTLVMGPFGRTTAGAFYGIAGLCGYALIALGAVAAVRVITEKEPPVPLLVTIGTLLGVIACATLVHLVAPGYRVAGHGPGGAIGEHLAEVLRALIGTAGTALLAWLGLVIAVIVATPLRMRDVLDTVGSGIRTAARGVAIGAKAFAKFWVDVFRAILPERGRDDDDDDDEPEIEVVETDVLEASDDERAPEPVIIERTLPGLAVEASDTIIELTQPKKKKEAKDRKSVV